MITKDFQYELIIEDNIAIFKPDYIKKTRFADCVCAPDIKKLKKHLSSLGFKKIDKNHYIFINDNEYDYLRAIIIATILQIDYDPDVVNHIMYLEPLELRYYTSLIRQLWQKYQDIGKMIQLAKRIYDLLLFKITKGLH